MFVVDHDIIGRTVGGFKPRRKGEQGDSSKNKIETIGPNRIGPVTSLVLVCELVLLNAKTPVLP